MSQYKSVPDDADWEPGERHLIRRFCKPGDRLLELGTAIGSVAITAASVIGPENVLTFDANPAMIEKARENFEIEGMPQIQTKLGLCENRKHFKSREMNFFIAKSFVDSRLFSSHEDDMSDIIGCVRIKSLCLEDEMAAQHTNVLVVDIEGGEVDLLTDADLTGVRLLIVEVHPGRAGTHDDIRHMTQRIEAQGFREYGREQDTVIAYGREVRDTMLDRMARHGFKA